MKNFMIKLPKRGKVSYYKKALVIVVSYRSNNYRIAPNFRNFRNYMHSHYENIIYEIFVSIDNSRHRVSLASNNEFILKYFKP